MRSFKLFAARLNLIFGEACNPEAPLDDTLDRLEAVLGAGVDQSEQALNNTSSGAVSFKVNQQTSLTSRDLGWLLGIISKVMYIET